METKRGCVYFFKHIGLNPIKVGFSTNESPISRFEQFKTYAPFGAELVGFIRTEKPKDLETLLHQKFAIKRLSGEWFDLDLDEVKKTIEFYSKIEDVQEMNNFQIAWAKKISLDANEDLDLQKRFFNHFSIQKTSDYNKKTVLNLKELEWVTSIKKEDLKQILAMHKIRYSSHRNGAEIKKGYKLYCVT